MMKSAGLLQVHGFVLAGGKSSRMGRDKALLSFQGRPMVEIAVEKLRSFCAEVSISGNRDDLGEFGGVISEVRQEAGPVAGMEAGLRAAVQSWAMFVPVDVPVVPERLLAAWAETVLEREGEGVRLSYLSANGIRQPAFCLLHRECMATLTRAVDDGVLKLGLVFERVATALGGDSVWMAEAETFAPVSEKGMRGSRAWFCNVNTPEDLQELEKAIRPASSAG